MPGVKYSAYYKRIAGYPELARFRRYPEEWSWRLYRHSAEINRLKEECNACIRKLGLGEVTVTDLQSTQIEQDSELNQKVQMLDRELVEYSKNLWLAHKIISKLPEQSQVFAKHLASFVGLFQDGFFGPTGEEEDYYRQVPPPGDTAALKGVDHQDVIGNFLMENITTMNKGVRRLAFWRREEQDIEAPQNPSDIDLDTIRGLMNLVTALYGPLLYTVSMLVVSCIKPIKIQIIVVGILGLVLAISMQLMVENVKRGELLTVVAGYFAVLGIFIGNTGGSVSH